MINQLSEQILIPEAPAIEGLRFRRFRGDEDFPRMVAIIQGSVKADNIQRVSSVEEVRNNYAHLTNCDPATDMLIVEVEGQPNNGVIGYTRVFWWQIDATQERMYMSFGFLLPEWRRKGIGRALLKHNQRRLLEIAADHPRDGARFFTSSASNNEISNNHLLLSDGYAVASTGAEMIRPNLDDIGTTTLPDGIEVRPVLDEHLPAIHAAEVEAFRDHYGSSAEMAESVEQWQQDPHYDPSLWRVAWQGDQIVGMVRSFINPAENAEYGIKRGWTEHISVRRQWRKMGVARALLNLSLHAIKERGMEQAALGVHVENPNGAFHLYESCGFAVVRMDAEYRKPM